MELLESNNLLAGWSGFELRSTPLQSKKITAPRTPTPPPISKRTGSFTAGKYVAVTFMLHMMQVYMNPKSLTNGAGPVAGSVATIRDSL